MNIGVDGWMVDGSWMDGGWIMGGWVCLFGYGKLITRSTFVSNHKGESMQSLAARFVHDPDPFFSG
jgi:hypothetical protein